MIIGIGAKIRMDSKKLQEEMMVVVKSEEAKQVFEKGLHILEPEALTNEGIIESYEIDFESINHNPMGGINVTLVINKDNNLTIEYDIDKRNEILEGGGMVISPELSKKLGRWKTS